MAKLQKDAQKYYKPHFGLVSWLLVLSIFPGIDIIKFLLDAIPVVDLLNILISIVVWGAENVFFMIKLGPNYLGGKNAGKKQAVTVITALLGLIPILDGVDFDETIDAVGMMWAVHDGDIQEANDKAVKEEVGEEVKAANDNALRQAEANIRAEQEQGEQLQQAA